MKNPKTIIITGASSGIGAALAEYYAAEGITLGLTGRHADRLSVISEVCRKKGAKIIEGVVDVTDQKAMEDWLLSFDKKYPADLVIANAGISGGTGGAEKMEGAGQVRSIFDINLTGVLNTIDPLLPRMIARGKGQIALMSSLASFSGWPGAPAYSASKGAVRLYGEALHGSLAAKKIEVSVICPGFIRTPLTAVNDYPMPFLMEVEDSAPIIAKSLAKGRGRIAFPWQTYLLAGFFGLLPHFISSAIFRKLPEKPHSEP